MKVGTDGMLLGAWASTYGAQRALDIGTGTGLVALMLAQRSPTLRLDALEIDADAASQATENVATSPFSERVDVLPQAVQDFSPLSRYDLIVSNPPYFEAGTGRLPKDPARLKARHQHHLSISTLLAHTADWLTPTGRAAFVFPFAQQAQWLRQAQRVGLFPQRTLTVRPMPYKAPNRLLLELSRDASPSRVEEAELTIRFDTGRLDYTEAYKEMLAPFLLDF